jgi:hypothetical protein
LVYFYSILHLRNTEWSFSSDDQYQPPALEQLYPTETVSAQTLADFELVTIGRLDFFA